jgi:hypothetical protein
VEGGFGDRECGTGVTTFKPRLCRGSLRPSPAARVPVAPSGAVRRLSKPPVGEGHGFRPSRAAGAWSIINERSGDDMAKLTKTSTPGIFRRHKKDCGGGRCDCA